MRARGLGVAALTWLAALAALAGTGAALADHGPVIVVPGKAGQPVLRYGGDLSGTLGHGDWGLHRAGHGRFSVEGPVYFPVQPVPGAYYPYTGMKPRYGRYEVEDRRPPRPGPRHYREWGIESDPSIPATEYPPYEPPAVTVEPRQRWR
jgi:hypothetical protein